ncbi:peptide chain release factor 2 [Mycoplasmatota bacterium]|nr:peptide chain release factor 2 [Mycoplasmatota bacterium]
MDLLEIKQLLKEINDHFKDLNQYIDQDAIDKEMKQLNEVMNEANFWSNQREAKKVIDRNNYLKNQISTLDDIKSRIEDVEVGIDLIEDFNDETLIKEMSSMVKQLHKDINQFEIELLLSEIYDQKNAILEIHPGAGGTESQDWGEMLLRMYTRYAEDKDFKVEILDYLPGEEAGIKSVTLLIKGTNAYGYLKAEKGVHRLVRISPFDSSGRRHTSFASVDVMPELDEEVEIDIKSDDLKIDTYRSSGAGGQHVNTTDSAIRITHLPTGIVVTCQNGRSQIANRETAMKMLKTKLYQHELQKQQEELQNLRGEYKEIGWGSQIRSYVFHPYSLVKDHRTSAEMGNIQSVMDGNIDFFINEYLKHRIKN